MTQKSTLSKKQMAGILDRICELAGLAGNKENERGNISDFARKIDVDASVVSKWLQGARNVNPTAELICRICDAYEITSDWLLFGTTPKFRKDVIDKQAHLIELQTKNAEIEKLRNMAHTEAIKDLLKKAKG